MLMKAHHAKVTLAGGKEVYEENKKIKEVEKDNQRYYYYLIVILLL